MPKFTDTIKISIRGGKGGPGSVSFRREKYIAKGGPDGGDGGTGGNIIFEADRRYYNLSHFFKDRIYKAGSGLQGMGRNKHGKDGEDLIVRVPPGTQIIDAETEEVLTDLLEEKAPYIAARGGIGGRGNAFFKSSTHQSPRFSQPGIEGEEKELILNLKLIADVGLVGLPNAGKSTLLSKITNAKPKIANYPFTTLIPNLGIVERKNYVFKIADIPGIIEGAHKGHGLGLSFLQHIERVKIILYLIDITEDDLQYNFELLQSELNSYSDQMVGKKHLVVLTKTDLIEEEEIKEKCNLFGEHVVTISSISGNHLNELLNEIDVLLEAPDAP